MAQSFNTSRPRCSHDHTGSQPNSGAQDVPTKRRVLLFELAQQRQGEPSHEEVKGQAVAEVEETEDV